MERYLTSPLPNSCKISWKPEWGRVIVIRLKNSTGNNDNYENFKITIAPIDGIIIGMLKSEITPQENYDDQWFVNTTVLWDLKRMLILSQLISFCIVSENHDKPLISFLS